MPMSRSEQRNLMLAAENIMRRFDAKASTNDTIALNFTQSELDMLASIMQHSAIDDHRSIRALDHSDQNQRETAEFLAERIQFAESHTPVFNILAGTFDIK